jgi:hypothetical protein
MYPFTYLATVKELKSGLLVIFIYKNQVLSKLSEF